MGLAPLFAQGALPAETQLKDWARLGHKAVLALANLPQITIASVQGHAIGGGFLLLAACDFRLAENETRFALPEIDIGLPLTWGGVDRLMHLLGRPRKTLLDGAVVWSQGFTAYLISLPSCY